MTDLSMGSDYLPAPRTAKSRAGSRRAAFGLAAAAVGGIVTYATYSNAGPGDTYVVWWGPIVFGLAFLFQGLAWVGDRAGPGWYDVSGARRYWDGQRWTDRTPFRTHRRTEDAFTALARAGLEAEGGRRLTDEEYGDAPAVAVQTARVLVPSLGPGRGGRLFAFDDPEDLRTTRGYYEDLGAEDPNLASWLFDQDNLLLQLPRTLPETSALRYRDALGTLASG